MRQGHMLDSQATAGGEDSAPILTLSLNLTDYSGRKRQGRAVLLPRWPAEPNGERPADGEDFRIVVLSEPPEGPVSPAEGVVVSAPARRLPSQATGVGEAVTTSSAGKRSGLALPPEAAELLRQGRLFAAAPLLLSAEDIFTEGKARLTLLARDLLSSIAIAEYLSPIAIALNAPDAAKAASQERLVDLKNLVSAVGDVASEANGALARLSELVFAADREQFLACAERVYPNKQALMEDIYTLRAFRQSPEDAGEMVAIRRFLEQAIVPTEEADLALDRSLVVEQLTFATLCAEPQRLPPAKAMLETFRKKYISAYRDHHTRYWVQMARLHARLREEQAQVEALQRLNTLTELGPPMGAGALIAYEQLVADTAGCPLITGVEEMLESDATCPACRLAMETTAPVQRADEILQRIERGCQRQMARLSSNAVQQVLHRSNDARVEQFLKMVQASQLSSLGVIMNDELVGYIRRFLVESRIHEALRPILDQLEKGASPKVDEARGTMREVSHVLQRAFQATHRALPPGDTTVAHPASRSRKRRR